MNLPLNEWAAELRPGVFMGNEPWNGFMKMVRVLADEYDVQKILFTKHYISALYDELYTLQSGDERSRILTFFNKYIGKCTDYSFSEEFVCREEGAKDDTAILLTLAYNEDVPVVSILYDDIFACDSLKACLYNARKGKGVAIELKNLHTGNLQLYNDSFFMGRPSRELRPQLNPIWNMERTRRFCDALPSMEGVSKEEKNAMFFQEGTHVARLNGWVEDRNLSKINSKNLNKIRHVFRPVMFRDKDAAYLSIDYEKRAFELLDRRGHHIGEISYLGKKNTGYKPNHDIKLKW